MWRRGAEQDKKPSTFSPESRRFVSAVIKRLNAAIIDHITNSPVRINARLNLISIGAHDLQEVGLPSPAQNAPAETSVTM